MTEMAPKTTELPKLNIINLNETTKKILKIDTEALNKKFFNKPFNELTLNDQNKMYNQFQEVLKLIDDFKKENESLTNIPISNKAKVSIFNSEELKSPFPTEKK